MRFDPIDPPRRFEVGFGELVELRDCGRVLLEPDEQVTFVAGDAEYDVTRKDFGFYATPSTNGRLADFGLRTVLVRNRIGRAFVLLVHAGREDAFERYVAVEELDVVTWLDTDEAVATAAERLAGP